VWDAHNKAKRALIDYVNQQTGAGMDPEVATQGFARRAAAYKRADLLVSDAERLKAIAAKFGKLQIVYAGKAHPRDGAGKDVIRRVHDAMGRLGPPVSIVYLPNYEMPLGRLITGGVDVWVNTPQRPLEASGTSGMKAALNGVPSLSVLDGWWIEGCIENVTGWAIGPNGSWPAQPHDDAQDGASLYDKLEHAVLPMYDQQRDTFIDVMKHAIAVNGAYFNTQRMVQEYVVKAYYS
jgi:starch phosphorylase